MNNTRKNINLNDYGRLKAGQDGIDRNYFKLRVRQMEQTLARQRSLLADYSIRLRRLRQDLQIIESRLGSIAA